MSDTGKKTGRAGSPPAPASSSGKGRVARLHPSRPCPICNGKSSTRYHPFCSLRCSNIDLNRWLSGAYVIPGEPADIESMGEGDIDGKGTGEF